MKTKLQFGILVLLLAFLSRQLEDSTVPNQQMVIQFSDENISVEDAENTIEAIHAKLQRIGAEQIQIGQSENGQLKITYFSNADVDKIQHILSSAEGLELANDSQSKSSNDFPSEKISKDYKLNISEIQNNSDVNWDFETIEVVELNQKSEHSYNHKVKTSGEYINTKHSNSIINIAIKCHTTIVIAIDNASYKIPEVRAGPIV
ncbi:hypothetical protein [uncultured Winogradskyella sp.]|uniref:hypothetical protein n=1 Tax=uncultured Winogradskyella sp. TaxID=395353 RepID=UPI00261447C6|nr:hypothetical protein [uncultured Winogradskyella sp.]